MKQPGGKIIIAFVVLCGALILAVVTYATYSKKSAEESRHVPLPVVNVVSDTESESVPTSITSVVDERVQALIASGFVLRTYEIDIRSEPPDGIWFGYMEDQLKQILKQRDCVSLQLEEGTMCEVFDGEDALAVVTYGRTFGEYYPFLSPPRVTVFTDAGATMYVIPSPKVDAVMTKLFQDVSLQHPEFSEAEGIGTPKHAAFNKDLAAAIDAYVASSADELVEATRVTEQVAKILSGYQDPRIRFDLIEQSVETGRVFGDVYYLPESGGEVLIGDSVIPQTGTECDTWFCSKEYSRALVSPDGRFVALTFIQWEDYGYKTEIYDVVTGEKHVNPLMMKGELMWLPDGRLQRSEVCHEKPEEERVNGPYHMNLDCTWVEESVSADKPWEIQKVE